MAQLGFGLNINETAQEAGYDQFSQGLGDTLKAVAADNWNFNPISSILLYQDILQERRNAVNKMIYSLTDKNLTQNIKI